MPLPGRLDEFRTALEEEIKAAQRDSSNVVLLTAGRFVAEFAGEFHYDFETSVPVRVPPDTPGELVIEGRETPIDVTVVTVEEVTVTLASAEHLGRALSNAKLKTNLTLLLRRLIVRIEQKAVESWSAADRLLEGGPVSGEPAKILGLDDLEPEQHDALKSALGRDLTFIWGPPGAGKTKTIGSIGRELFKQGRTLLLVSHTNVAVDEALYRIAQLSHGKFKEGEIIRIGEPVKAELADREDLICHRIAAKRSEELKRTKETLERERQEEMGELKELERLTTVVEWVEEAANDLRDFRDGLASLTEMEVRRAATSDKLANASAERSGWETRKRAATEAQLKLDRRASAIRQQQHSTEIQTRIEMKLAEIDKKLVTERNHLASARVAEPFRRRRANLPLMADLLKAEKSAHEMSTAQASRLAADEKTVSEALGVLSQAESMGKIRRLWHGLPEPTEQKKILAQRQAEAAEERSAMEEAATLHRETMQRRKEAEDLDDSLRAFSNVLPLAEQERICKDLEQRHSALLEEATACSARLRETTVVVASCDQMLNGFWQEYGCRPDESLGQVDVFYQCLGKLDEEVEELRVSYARARQDLASRMRKLLAILREVGLTEEYEASPADMLHAIEAAHSRASAMACATPREDLIRSRGRLSVHVAQLSDEIRAIEDQLTRVERDIILNARVIATTLTRAFMRDALHEREFDTVLCDEASMAPIPALWTAATLAGNSVVIVGDFLQLPPIVQSEHKIAMRWLGRDIFEVSGVQAAYERKKSPPFFVPLRRQFRMHPEISDAPNALIYKGMLTDGDGVSGVAADQKLLAWYQPESEFDRPLLLLDTAELGCWNNKAGNSRLNFQSAALCVRLACACLGSDRPQWNSREGRRIFIITPYRPHAALINLLLQDENILGEVRASTAHSCQGGEAELVVLDLVVDQPHIRANLMSGACDEDIRRLINVAMTRAKRRLVVIGNFSWFTSKGRGAFLGGELLPYLIAKHEPVEAIRVMTSLGNTSNARLVSGAKALAEIRSGIMSAERSLTVLTPGLAADSFSSLAIELSAAAGRGVEVLVVTRPLHEDGACKPSERETVDEILASLRARGVIVVMKTGMHEKLILADKKVVWIASFPPFTCPGESGVVEVRGSFHLSHPLRFSEEVMECLGLEHVFTAARENQLVCPVCGSDMWMADSGPKFDQPFYWRCAKKGCFTRSLHEPSVVNGLLAFACGGHPALDYRGTDPIWICDCGRHHRTKVKKAHLHLPKMWAIVPKQRRNRLLRQLGICAEDLFHQSELRL